MADIIFDWVPLPGKRERREKKPRPKRSVRFDRQDPSKKEQQGQDVSSQN